MRYLRIEDNRAYFVNSSGATRPIDEIGKDDLLFLIDRLVEGDFDMDEFVEEHLQNQAHSIIYKNIYERLTELLDNRDRFKDESRELYKEALEKYSKS